MIVEQNKAFTKSIVEKIKEEFTENNLKCGITVLFSSGEHFDFKFRNEYEYEFSKKVDQLITNLKKARRAAGNPQMIILFNC